MKMAGMAQVLSHRDPSHARDSLLRLNKLRREGILCDMTILVQGQKFKAHKTVMAACSDYFLATICGAKNSPSVSISNEDHITIELKYVTVRGFTPLLEYAYSSDLHVNSSDVIDVLSAASYMQMFNVANACSEFMRSNLLWTQAQPRLAALPLIQGTRPMLLNGQNHSTESSPVPTTRSNGLPEAVNNLLQASRPTGIAQPPMLMSMSSMSPYDVGLQNWVDTVAGTQTLLSRFVNGQSGSTTLSPASSVSPSSSPHNSPSNGWTLDVLPSSSAPQDVRSGAASLGTKTSPRREGSPAVREAQGPGSREKSDGDDASESNKYKESSNNNNNSNNNNHSSSRKSVAIKLETTSDSESNDPANDGTVRRESTSPPNDSEDSWQSLQRLYSFQSKAAENIFQAKRAENEQLQDRNSGSPALHNSLALKSNSLQAVFEKISEAMPRIDAPVSMVPRLNGLSVHTALLQHQQQLLASQQQQQQQQLAKQQQQQQQNEEPEKLLADLPAVPPGGQYMSVRRRTLQSNVPKPHQCQICGSRFTRFHNLKQHIKLHSGIKPYECDECGKRFTRNYTLRLHKMKHVGIRNFKCGTCDASFTSLGEFRAHLRITMHSHLPVGSGASPQASTRIGDADDLSNAHMSPSLLKFEQFEPGMLGYRVGSPGSSGGGAAGEGSTGTLSPPALQNISNMAHSGYYGSESPHLSDRSLSGSPQDLTTKRSLADMEEKPCASESMDESQRTPKSEEDVDVEAKRARLEGVGCPTVNDDDDAAGPDEPMALVVDTSASTDST